MERSSVQPEAWVRGSGNFLLQSLPREDYAAIAKHLEPFELESQASLYDPDVVIQHVYFPSTGMVSMLGVFTDGTGVETTVIGREGMVGVPVFHGTDRIAEQAVVQLGGKALRMTSEALRACVAESAALRLALHHFAACQLMFASQSVACMSKHGTTHRLARWLLHASDHSGYDEIDLTQLFLSHMLGVRRSSVTVAAANLRKKGLISYSRKTISITDRAGLANHSCECYRIVRATYDRLIFGDKSRSPLADVESSRGGRSVLGSPSPDPGSKGSGR
jgi:CRP-like cAMP-binding protein